METDQWLLLLLVGSTIYFLGMCGDIFECFVVLKSLFFVLTFPYSTALVLKVAPNNIQMSRILVSLWLSSKENDMLSSNQHYFDMQKWFILIPYNALHVSWKYRYMYCYSTWPVKQMIVLKTDGL